MSGSEVVLPDPDGRLIGIVVTAEAEHEERRLYLVPLADALSQAPTFARRLADVAGEAPVVQARAAPDYERVCEKHSLGPDGLPRLIGEIEDEDLGVFGVPTMVFNGELFWGGDRIDMLIERIKNPRTIAAALGSRHRT